LRCTFKAKDFAELKKHCEPKEISRQSKWKTWFSSDCASSIFFETRKFTCDWKSFLRVSHVMLEKFRADSFLLRQKMLNIHLQDPWSLIFSAFVLCCVTTVHTTHKYERKDRRSTNEYSDGFVTVELST
jgi:hypothetical protein